ncbi:WxL domain-containing protein [Enterococcus sp. AZ163]|uniref:WxL domain-containing protein n=1 Tax=Enterococcus sp. AZ163 TaxID=2774638 RepID=UPI003D28F208
MNKKKLATALLGTAMMGGLLVQAMPAAAAPVSGGSTGGSVGFTGHTPPTPNGGDLDLLWYPTAFEFGNSNTHTTAAKTYTATNGATKYAVVKDERIANGTTVPTDNGWKLTAAAKKLEAGTDVLTNAEYSFTGNVLKEYVSASGQDTEVPESTGAIVPFSPAPTEVSVAGTTSVTLKASGLSTDTVTMMESTDPGIDGKFALEMNAISLKVPANTSKDGKQYAGKIDWVLQDSI